MLLQRDGISLWYGTSDARGPSEAVWEDAEITVTVGVQPVDGSNSVELLYRTNQGPPRTIAAKWLSNDSFGDKQYFRASFPASAFRAGDTVEYTPICRCAGRQVPSPEDTEQFASSFEVLEAGVEPTRGLPPEEGFVPEEAPPPEVGRVSDPREEAPLGASGESVAEVPGPDEQALMLSDGPTLSFGITSVTVNGVNVPFTNPPPGQPIRIKAPAFSVVVFDGFAIPEEGVSSISWVRWNVNNGPVQNAERTSEPTIVEWNWRAPPTKDPPTRIGAAGIYSFGFECRDSRGGGAGASAVVEASSAFQVTITEPKKEDEEDPEIYDTAFNVQAYAASPSSDVEELSWSLNKDGTSLRNGKLTLLSGDKRTGTWSASISLPPPSPSVPAGGTSYQLVVTGKNQFETATVEPPTLTVKAIDGTPPTLKIKAPEDGSEVPGTLNGGSFDLIVEPSDTGSSGKLYSDVDKVEWSLAKENIPSGWPHPTNGQATP